MTPTDAIPILIGEQWITPEVEDHTPVYRPATGEVIGRTPQCGSIEVDLAVEAASRAFSSWSAMPGTGTGAGTVPLPRAAGRAVRASGRDPLPRERQDPRGSAGRRAPRH